MPSMTSRRASRRANVGRSARVGTCLATVATGAGLLATAGPAAAATPTSAPLMDRGSTGSTVAQVQRALHIGASGRFNAQTAQAVVAFQRKQGLQVDGIVGQETYDALFHITPTAALAASSTSSASSTGTSSTATSSSGGYTIPASIVQCESHGNYSAVNSGSGAGGAYQILPSTWQAYGGQGLPQDASPAEQGRIAAEIYAHEGSSAWQC